MGLEFRRRDYRAENQTRSLPRAHAEIHPLSAPSPSVQVEQACGGDADFFDPLRAADRNTEVSVEDMHIGGIDSKVTSYSGTCDQSKMKEWSSFGKILMQRFPVSKTTPVSMMFDVSAKINRGTRKSSGDLNSEELVDDDKFVEEDAKIMSQQEYILKLNQLKDEIRQSWNADDRITSLRLSIKVARLLMNTSVIQFYPTLFVLATDIMDMLGDLVWSRIKQKAEFAEGGRSFGTLPDNFGADIICFDAKETCNNWFCKIAAVPELLPRIYLELAILPCWRFLIDHHQDILQRLVLMMRGIADPLASAYCHLYVVHRAQKLLGIDRGYLIICINDLKVLIMRLISLRGSTHGNNISLLSLIEPTIEYLIRCLFKDLKQIEVVNILVALEIGNNPSTVFENCSCLSIILHHILKELPIGFACSNALEIVHLIERSDDCSFDQVLSGYSNLEAYLMIADAYLDVICENQLYDRQDLLLIEAHNAELDPFVQNAFINVILDGLFERVREKKIGETALLILQSIFLKLLAHFDGLENSISLNHFIDILDMMHGSPRNSVNMHILSMATRKASIQDPAVIELLFEIAQSLYDGLDFSNIKKEDYQHPASLISRFVFKVDYGELMESHLRFLVHCRGAFASIIEIQEILIHSTNNLAVRAMRCGIPHISFVKSCLAFNEATIPAIPSILGQLNLYLETTEVALLGGFISHTDGLIDAATNCLCSFDSVEGLWIPENVDWIISLICKLYSILVMVPGNPERGVACIPDHVLSFIDSQSWLLPRMRIKMLSAAVYLSAALSQNPLLYHPTGLEDMGNDRLFFGVPSYPQELHSLTVVALQRIVNAIMQEPSMAVRGKTALEVCNCIASCCVVCNESLAACFKLVEIAKSCLKADNKFLLSTLKFLDSHRFVLPDNGEAD